MKTMSILLISRTRNMKPIRDALLNLDGNLDVEIWPDIKSRERVIFAVAWNQPTEQFSYFPNLKAVSSLGAGADHLLKDQSIPANVVLTRVVASSLSEQMCDYVIMSILNMLRKTNEYTKQQKRAEWISLKPHKKDELMVGVMGLGQIGEKVTSRLTLNGFNVSGWSKTKKAIQKVTTYSKDQLETFLTATNVLVCLLPLTSETKEILDLNLFKKLKKPGFLVNVARGEHLIEEDLLYALDMNLLDYATLDVFQKEPLPESHPFWGRENITLTPHIASLTDPEEVAGILLENYKRILSGQDLKNWVDRHRGY